MSGRLPDRQDEGGYKPGAVVPFPTRPWPPPHASACYLPQNVPSTSKDAIPHSSHRIDGVPEDDKTGIKAVVDRYSITKFSPSDWKRHNARVLEGEPIRRADRLEIDTKNCLTQVYGIADKEFNCNTDLLKKRAYDIYQWKAETEYCIKAMTEEIVMLEELRQRFRSALAMLEVPESIAKECLELRSNRVESDLVLDPPEEELIKELTLISDIRNLFLETLHDIETQLTNNKSAKARVEFDWSDKVVSYDTESLNISLNKQSTTVLMKPGSVRVPEQQSSMIHWEDFSKCNVEEAENLRQHSIALRKFVEAMLINTARDLRMQAQRVDQALAERATCTDELRARLEDELTLTLEKLKTVESLIEEIREALRRMDLSMKVTQTRLDNRQITGRPNVENCRDVPQCGLLEEVKSLSECSQSLNEKFEEAKRTRTALMQSRNELEREISVKKKSLSIDRDRCKGIRSFYPSASKLSGHD